MPRAAPSSGSVTSSRPRLGPALLLLGALGCNHAEAFHLPPQDPKGPFDDGFPRQMTYGGPDLTPARSGDGKSWLYSFSVRTSDVILDRCLAGLPLTGGGQTRTHCDVTFGRSGLASLLTWPTELADGRLVYLRNLAFPNNGPVFDESLVLGRFALRDSGVVLRHFPYRTAHGLAHGIRQPALLDGHTLIFVTTRVDYLGPQSADSAESGLQIERLDLDHPPATPDILANTELASSVDPLPDGRGFYYTVNGDSRVYRRILATGATDTIFDFGGQGIARDVRMADSVLYAVVGGDVSIVPADTSATGMIQRDHGGDLMRVDLRTGATTPISFGLLAQDPVLSRDGRLLLFVDYGSRNLFLAGTP